MKKIESWQEKNQRELHEFLGEWNWDKVFEHWTACIDRKGALPNPLF